MSNPLKKIGKAFKKVVKTVKKYALPAIAIGAAVFTGGAALGVFGAAGAGGLGGLLGLGGTLGSIVSAAGTGALIGTVGSVVTGSSITKGAVGGLVAGALTGGVSAIARGGLSGGLSAAATGGDKAAFLASKGTAAAAGNVAKGLPSVVSDAVSPTVTSQPAIDAAISQQTAGVPTIAGPGAGIPKVPTVASAPNPASTVTASPGVAAPTSGGGGGIGRFLSENPFLTANLVSGLGNALNPDDGSAQLRARQDIINENFGEGGGGFYNGGGWAWDPNSRRMVQTPPQQAA